jgi:cellulose synthase/poly-beta-1,6-N-acetylglucosamine synthase-like glycosyltransferase
MSAPLASVLVPVYNVGPYVGSCLESLLAQDMPGTRLERLFPETPNRSISGKQKQTKKAHSVFIADMSFFLS